MAKAKVQYQCTDCGATLPKWAGQCGKCHAWNTMTETVIEVTSNVKSLRNRDHIAVPSEVCFLDTVDAEVSFRLSTGMTELDRAVGGGLATGSVTLIGGDPGIGKSTLLIQMLSVLGSEGGVKTLYVSGEESAQQISLRGHRLDLVLEQIKLLTENNLERILSVASAERPEVIVIDSIQTVYTEILQSAPGSVAQVRESAAQLVRYAKQTNTTVLLAGGRYGALF